MLIRQPCTGFFDYVALFTLPKDSHSKGFFCFFVFLFFFLFFFLFSVGICLIYVLYQSLVSSQTLFMKPETVISNLSILFGLFS